MERDIRPDNKDFSKDNNGHITLWSRAGVFSKDESLIEIIKKTERISAGIYLVTSIIKDEDPVKWELRDLAVDFSLHSNLFIDTNPAVRTDGIVRFANTSSKIISILNMCKLGGSMAVSNVDILKNEIEKTNTVLLNSIERSVKSAGYVLSDSFFDEDKSREDNKGHIKDNVDISAKNINKNNLDTTISSVVNNPYEFRSTEKSHIVSLSEGGSVVQKKSKREEVIIDILKKGGSLSIKDFTSVIKDCSEKTIQRELLAMVEKGLIRKEGERRWSRYFL